MVQSIPIRLEVNHLWSFYFEFISLFRSLKYVIP